MTATVKTYFGMTITKDGSTDSIGKFSTPVAEQSIAGDYIDPGRRFSIAAGAMVTLWTWETQQDFEKIVVEAVGEVYLLLAKLFDRPTDAETDYLTPSGLI